MAITNAQQYQQLVNKPADGKRPGYRGDDAYGSNSQSGNTGMTGAGNSGDKGRGRDLDYQQHGGKTKSTFETFRGGKNIGIDNKLASKYGNRTQRAAANKALAKGNLFSTSPNQSFFEKTGTTNRNFRNRNIKKFIDNSIRKDLYRSGFVPNTNVLGINIPNTANILAETGYSVFGPSVDLFDEDSKREIASTLTTTGGSINKSQSKALESFGKNIANRDELLDKGMTQSRFEELYPGPVTPKDDGPSEPTDPCKGPNPPAYCFIGANADENTEAQEENPQAIPYRLMAEGGIMNSMDDDIRQQLFLGGIAKGIKKAVKGATRAVKKIAKSKVGKAALLAAGGYYLGGGNLFGLQRAGMSGFSFGNLPGASFFGKGIPASVKSKAAAAGLSPREFMMGMGGKEQAAGGFLSSLFGGMSTGKKAALGIGALSALPLLGIGTGNDEEEGEAYRGEGLDIAGIRRNPYLAMQRSGSPYRLMAEGGDTEDAEPVAKKTMPLLDMGGKEKDYRETGGFVDMGRMEKADDVPARLSKNEFVFTADAVRNAGEGDIDKGAEVMYNMMKNLESGGEVSEESQGLEGAKEMFQTSQRLEGVM